MANLVHDLARLGVDVGVVLGRLQVGEHLEGAAGQLGPEHERLQAGDQRVAAEHGHEPGHARRGQTPGADAAGAAHPQRCEIGNGLRERMAELVPARADLRDAQLPRGQRLAHAAALLAEAALDRPRLDDVVAVQRRDDVDAHVPALARLELELPDDPRRAHLAGLRDDQLRAQLVVAVSLLEHELVVLAVEPRLDGGGEWARAHRVAEREVVLLDRQDVGEVRRCLEPELERDRAHRLVLDHDLVLHPLADEPLALDREAVLREAAGERVAQEEGGREVLDLAGGEQERPRAVHRQLEPGEEARVVGEEAVRLTVEIADLVADAEGRSFEDRELGHQPARTRPAARARANALITISSARAAKPRSLTRRLRAAPQDAAFGHG